MKLLLKEQCWKWIHQFAVHRHNLAIKKKSKTTKNKILILIKIQHTNKHSELPFLLTEMRTWFSKYEFVLTFDLIFAVVCCLVFFFFFGRRMCSVVNHSP